MLLAADEVPFWLAVEVWTQSHSLNTHIYTFNHWREKKGGQRLGWGEGVGVLEGYKYIGS